MPLNAEAVDRGLAWALERNLVEGGVAQRVRLIARLADRGRVSGQELAQMLGISRAGVHKHVRHFRESGLRVESLSGSGYLLDSPWDSLLPEAVLACLLSQKGKPAQGDLTLGLPYSYLAQAPSTNTLLKSGAESGLPAGAVLATDDQTAGRGRLGRSWASEPAKDLTFSYLLRPSLAPSRVHLAVLAASVGVAEALLSYPALQGRVSIKWPNDVHIDGRKVCGILAESSMDMDQIHWVVVGLGLNVNGQPGPELSSGGQRPPPIAVSQALGQPVPRVPLLVTALGALARGTALLEAGQMDAVIGAYSALDALRGRRVVVCSSSLPQEVLEGVAEGLGPNGELVVRQASGRVHLLVAGEVTLADHGGPNTA
jgi:BirA family biotin operon repressor/biotin-[acetyl-CoA-carboxylase] ligase